MPTNLRSVPDFSQEQLHPFRMHQVLRPPSLIVSPARRDRKRSDVRLGSKADQSVVFNVSAPRFAEGVGRDLMTSMASSLWNTRARSASNSMRAFRHIDKRRFKARDTQPRRCRRAGGKVYVGASRRAKKVMSAPGQKAT
jgi:hypothetical protein